MTARFLGSWTLRTRADTPPQIAFDGEPAATERGTLRIAYTGSDDYGITEIRGEMRRTYERGEVVGKEVSRFELPAPSLNAKEVKEATFQEIAPHPWAGLPVVIRLAAKDAAGQEGLSDEIKLVLPERKFNNPVAKEIIAERRRLTTQPERRDEIIDRINDIASDTQSFKDDTVVFLGLVMSRSRLFHEEEDSAIPPVRELLWDTALRVEDGQLSHAERELARAQDALMKALARNAPDAELERLMRELQNAMNRFMQEMAKKLQNNPNSEQVMPFDPTARIMQSSDIQRMMDQIRELMKAGSREAARQMLSQLRNMMESLRNARMMQSNPNAQRGNQAMRQLQEMIRRQNELMDKTFRQSQGRNPGQNQMQQGAQQQRDLREMLKQFEQMMKGMMPGDSKGMRALGQAGREMEGAAKSLGQGQPGQAVGQQGQGPGGFAPRRTGHDAANDEPLRTWSRCRYEQAVRPVGNDERPAWPRMAGRRGRHGYPPGNYPGSGFHRTRAGNPGRIAQTRRRTFSHAAGTRLYRQVAEKVLIPRDRTVPAWIRRGPGARCLQLRKSVAA
jgi:hypothetical protein